MYFPLRYHGLFSKTCYKMSAIIRKSRAPNVMRLFHARCTCDIPLATHHKSGPKFNVPRWHLSWAETAFKPPVLSASPRAKNKFIGVEKGYHVIWNLMHLFGDNNTLVLASMCYYYHQKATLDSINHWNSASNLPMLIRTIQIHTAMYVNNSK